MRLFLFTLFLFPILIFSQTKNKGIEFYDKGNIAFANRDYKLADSLFGVSLYYDAHPDTYFNRAICKQKLEDLTGFCINMKYAAETGDFESGQLFLTKCSKTDTLYTKNKDEEADRLNFDFAEVFTTYNYPRNTDYFKFDNKFNTLYMCEINVFDTIYTGGVSTKEPEFKYGNDSLLRYVIKNSKSLDTQATKLIDVKCRITFIVDTVGKVNQVKLLNGSAWGIGPELAEAIGKTSNWISGSINEQKVKFRKTIEFNITLGSVQLNNLKRSPSVYKKEPPTFTQVEQMPEFPGGPIEMMKFIQKNIETPKIVKAAGLSGKCYTKFVVNENGSISNITILKGIAGCHDCDNEVIRVIRLMPKWRPGTQNGIPVRVFFNLPITFGNKM